MMTKERIAEIADSVAARGSTHMHIVTPEALADLCRLALLGLRVEEAPWATALAPVPEPGVPDPGFAFVAMDVPPEWNGRRVRLVVEEP